MELIGQRRQKVGKAVKNLRKEGLVPAVIFGNEIEPTAIVLNQIAFGKVFSKAGETALIDLNVDSDSYKVLINEVQYNPITGKVIHASFYKPNLKEKTEVNVPVDIIGEEKNALVKSGGAVVLQLLNEVPVSALPSDLPDAFIVDVSELANIGDSISVGQLNYDKSKVEIVDLEPTDLVVKLDNAQMEEEPADAAAAAVSEQEAIEKLEATREKKPEEGEEAAGSTKDKKEKK